MTMDGLCPISNEGRNNISPAIETRLHFGKKTIKRSSEVKLSRKDSELVLTKHQQSLNIYPIKKPIELLKLYRLIVQFKNYKTKTENTVHLFQP